MRRAVLPGLAAVIVLTLFASRANACGQGGGYPSSRALVALGVGAIALGATDVALSLYDLPSIFTTEPRSAGYGAFETIVGGAQIALGVAGMNSRTNNGFWTGYTIWMSALTAHGIWSIIAASRPRTEGLAPAPDPPPGPASPLQLSVGATYVPVGQLAHPGFGLVGRF